MNKYIIRLLNTISVNVRDVSKCLNELTVFICSVNCTHNDLLLIIEILTGLNNGHNNYNDIISLCRDKLNV